MPNIPNKALNRKRDGTGEDVIAKDVKQAAVKRGLGVYL